MRFARLSFPVLCAAVFLTGCGFTADTSSPINTEAKGIHGKLMGGQQPVTGSLLSVYALGTTGYGSGATLLATTTSGTDGTFQFGSYTCPTETSSVTKSQTLQAGTQGKYGPEGESSESAIHVNGLPTPETTSRREKANAAPDTTQTYVYLTAVGGNAGIGSNSSIYLAAGLGSCTDAQSAEVEINEVSTVVTAFALSAFSGNAGSVEFGSTNTTSEIAAMDVADTNTIQTLLDLPTGTVQPNVIATGGGTSITIDASKIYSMANIIAACVNSADIVGTTTTPSSDCQNLFADTTFTLFTTPEVTVTPTNTLGAALAMAQAPYNNVPELWALAGTKPPFPGLSAAPNDWTVGVSYATSAMGLGLFPSSSGAPTSSNIDIDASGRVWFPSNKSGATGVAYFDPTTTTFNGPFGGSFLVQPQYVALDGVNQIAYVTDLASNNLAIVDTTPGSTNAVQDKTLSDTLGGADAPNSGPVFVDTDQSTVLEYTDSKGAFDMVSSNTGGLVVAFGQFPSGLTLAGTIGTTADTPSNPIAVSATSGAGAACHLEVNGGSTQKNLPTPLAATGSSCASGGAATGPVASGNTQDELTIASTPGEICSEIDNECLTLDEGTTSTSLVNLPQGIAFDGYSNIWIANSGNGSVTTYGSNHGTDYNQISDVPYLHGTGQGVTMTKPAGVAIDGGGNVWVSNATCTSKTDTTCIYTLSELVGAAGPTITPLANQSAGLQGTTP